MPDWFDRLLSSEPPPTPPPPPEAEEPKDWFDRLVSRRPQEESPTPTSTQTTAGTETALQSPESTVERRPYVPSQSLVRPAPERDPNQEGAEGLLRRTLSGLQGRREARSPYERLLASPPVAASRHVARGAAQVGRGILGAEKLLGEAGARAAEAVGADFVGGQLRQRAAEADTVSRALQGFSEALEIDPERGRGYVDQIQESPERAPEVVVQAVFENLPQLLGSGAALAKLGSKAGLSFLWAQEAGHEYETLKAQGADETKAAAGAAAVGAVNAALERVPVERLLKGVGSVEMGKKALRWMGRQAALEGGTEGVQEMASALTEKITTEEPWDWTRVAEAGAAGGLLGFLAGSASVRPRAEGKAETAQPSEDEALSELARASQEIAPSQPTEARAAEVLEEPGEGATRRLTALDQSGSPVGTMTFTPEPEGGFRVQDVETGARGSGGMRAMMRKAAEATGGPYRGSMAETAEGEGALARLRETDPDLFPPEEAAQATPAPESFSAFLRRTGRTPPKFGSREHWEALQEWEAGSPEAPARAPEGAGSIVERLPAAREGGDEGGFVRTDRNLIRDVKLAIDRQIKPQGNLPTSAWRLKLQKDHNLGAHEKGLEFRLRELNQKVRRYKGPLTKKQLTRYLGDALRGSVPLGIRAETASLDETQIQRIAERRGIDPEAVRQAVERAAEAPAEGGLPSAPEFLPLIGKLRADIDAVTRSLRREGLLDDAAARELERSAGLYVHRSYEAFRGKSKAHLRETEDSPLWNRAKELVSKEYPDFSEAEVEGMLREFIERGDRPTLPGNVPEGALNRSVLFQRKGVRDLERLLLGERRDVRSQALDTLIGQVSLLEHHRFLKALREDGLDRYLFKRPQGRFYRNVEEIPSPLAILEEGGEPATIYRTATHRRYGPMTASGKPGGKALHTTPEILQELEDSMPHASEWPLWLKLWSLGNFAVKTNLTVLSPTTTGRNYLSNVLAAMANGYTPWGGGVREGKTLVFRDIANSSDEELRTLYQKFVRLGIVDQGTDYGDLRRLGAMADLMRIEQDPGARPVTWAKTFLRKAGQVYQHGDNFWKILGWTQERARLAEANPGWGESKLDNEAAEIVRHVLQNYSELPRLARSISANPVVAPFFSFTWSMFRNVKQTAQQAAREVQSQNPATRKAGYRRAAGLTAALALPEMLTFALRYMSNTDDEDDRALREFVYPWDQGSNLGIVHHRPGEYTYFNWGFMDYFSRLKEPVRLVLQAARGDRDPSEVAGDVFADYGEEVLLGALIDVARGEAVDGYRVWLEKDSLSDRTGKSMDHLWSTGRPGVARNVENLNEAAKGEGSRKLWAEIAALAGPRFTTVNVRDRLDRYGKGFSRNLGEATRVYSQYANRSSDPGDDALLRGYRRANEERAKLIRDLRQKIDAAVVSGISADEVEEILRASGAPQKYIDMAWGGTFDPVDFRRGKHWERVEADLEALAAEAENSWAKEKSP